MLELFECIPRLFFRWQDDHGTSQGLYKLSALDYPPTMSKTYTLTSVHFASITGQACLVLLWLVLAEIEDLLDRSQSDLTILGDGEL